MQSRRVVAWGPRRAMASCSLSKSCGMRSACPLKSDPSTIRDRFERLAVLCSVRAATRRSSLSRSLTSRSQLLPFAAVAASSPAGSPGLLGRPWIALPGLAKRVDAGRRTPGSDCSLPPVVPSAAGTLARHDLRRLLGANRIESSWMQPDLHVAIPAGSGLNRAAAHRSGPTFEAYGLGGRSAGAELAVRERTGAVGNRELFDQRSLQ